MPRTTETDIDEIAVAIVDELKPLRAQKSRNEVKRSIRATLQESRWLMERYSRTAIQDNRRHIAKLRNSIGFALVSRQTPWRTTSTSFRECSKSTCYGYINFVTGFARDGRYRQEQARK